MLSRMKDRHYLFKIHAGYCPRQDVNKAGDIELLSQSKERTGWGRRDIEILTGLAARQPQNDVGAGNIMMGVSPIFANRAGISGQQ